MTIDLDDLLGNLPRVEASSGFKQDLLDQIPLLDIQSSLSIFTKPIVSVMMAASLALGVFVGLADIDALSASLSGLGLSTDNITLASEWSSTIDPFATTLGNL